MTDIPLEKDGSEESFRTLSSRLIEIGIALSAELNLDALLEKIVSYARELTFADAGTLYLLEDDRLNFKILQNDTLNIAQGGTTGKPIDLEPVPLQRANVSAYAALLKKTISIEDVYTSEEFDFSGPRRYDSVTGYRSQSMLVVPMKNHEGDVIGVLQLMNAIDPETKNVCAFSDKVVGLTEALTSQAAVSITNARLIEETKALFESLIEVLAVAIDEKSSCTRNHIQRVAHLNVTLAKAVNDKKEGPLADVHFSKDEMEEIRLAGWLHDVGKITTPEWVMDKSTKLQGIFDRIELIQTRFALIQESRRRLEAERKLEQLQDNEPANREAVDFQLQRDLEHIQEQLDFIKSVNLPTQSMDKSVIDELKSTAEEQYISNSESITYLTQDELHSLLVHRGTLTAEEIEIMRGHVVATKRMLEEIPFTKHLSKVPVYASQHHEKLNGSGYPKGLKGKEIPTQSRILAVADLYEALTARDRPYKKALPIDRVLEIMEQIGKNGEIDLDILKLFTEDRIHEKFEREFS